MQGRRQRRHLGLLEAEGKRRSRAPAARPRLRGSSSPCRTAAEARLLTSSFSPPAPVAVGWGGSVEALCTCSAQPFKSLARSVFSSCPATNSLGKPQAQPLRLQYEDLPCRLVVKGSLSAPCKALRHKQRPFPCPDFPAGFVTDLILWLRCTDVFKLMLQLSGSVPEEGGPNTAPSLLTW